MKLKCTTKKKLIINFITSKSGNVSLTVLTDHLKGDSRVDSFMMINSDVGLFLFQFAGDAITRGAYKK
jgi:hypothetical protein